MSNKVALYLLSGLAASALMLSSASAALLTNSNCDITNGKMSCKSAVDWGSDTLQINFTNYKYDISKPDPKLVCKVYLHGLSVNHVSSNGFTAFNFSSVEKGDNYHVMTAGLGGSPANAVVLVKVKGTFIKQANVDCQFQSGS